MLAVTAFSTAFFSLFGALLVFASWAPVALAVFFSVSALFLFVFFQFNNSIFFFTTCLFLVSIFLYVAFLFFSNFNYLTLWYEKKINFVNTNLDWVISFDYINIYFIILSNFIFFAVYIILFSTKFKVDMNSTNFFDNRNIKILFFLFLIIEFFLFLTFSTSNLFFFFFFFECTLIPMYFLIQLTGKGVKKKNYAGLSLVFFTLTGSIFLLLGIVYIIFIFNSCDFKCLSFELIDFNSQLLLFILFFVGFSVKAPIFPFYSWLPEAHVEASTSISVLLASIFLKVATYGFLKIVVFNFFIICAYYYSFIFYFSVISIFLSMILTLLQTDLKKIIALSSIIHMNYMILAIFSLDPKAILGSFLYMLSHAFVSSSLFLMVGILYDCAGTRDILNFNNAYKYNSKLFFFFLIFNLANISFPLTISFVSELMVINNMVFFNIFLIIFILISIFFSTIYTFWMIHNIFFGKLFTKKNFFFITKFDIFFLLTFLLIIVILGIIPSLVLFNLEQEIYLLLINKFNIY